MAFIGKWLGSIFGSSVAEPLKVVSELIQNMTLTEAQKVKANQAVAILNAKFGSIAKAKAFLIIICDVCMALIWIPQILIADYFLITSSFAAGKLTPFQFDPTRIMEFLVSALGLCILHYRKK